MKKSKTSQRSKAKVKRKVVVRKKTKSILKKKTKAADKAKVRSKVKVKSKAKKTTTSNIIAPIAQKVPTQLNYHNQKSEDLYFWLRQKNTPEVLDYLKKENHYFDQKMKSTESLQKKLFTELKGRIKEADQSYPYEKNGYLYYEKTFKGQEYPIYYRKKRDSKKEEVLLDVISLSKKQDYISIGEMAVSPDTQKLAYTVDTTGFREYHLKIMDLKSGKQLFDLGKVNAVEWGNDHLIYYTIENETKRPYQVVRFDLNTQKSEVIYQDDIGQYWVWVSKTTDEKFLLMGSGSSTTTEWHYLELINDIGNHGGIKSQLKVFFPRQEDHEYYCDHHEDKWYIKTNHQAKNFKVVKVDHPQNTTLKLGQWQEVLPHQIENKIDFFQTFRNHMLYSKLELGVRELYYFDYVTHESHRIHMPDDIYEASFAQNYEFEATTYRFAYSSSIKPLSLYEFDPNQESLNHRIKLLKQKEVPKYNPKLYELKRIFVEARDKTKIPVNLIFKKALLQKTKNQKKTSQGSVLDLNFKNQNFFMYGYGSYGFRLPLSFRPNIFSLVDRGFVYAYIAIRGGGDLGEPWHDAGKLKNKKNSFYDFIDVADFFVKQGWTSPQKLSMQGGSAGGLLMGAVLNERPDLVHAAHLAVPFVDVINTMMDTSLPLTTQEYLEWGDPNKKDFFEYMKSYCPYSNIKKTNYPHILVTTSYNDSQVMYWEPAKYVAKLRDFKTDANDLLFHINMSAGHGGASGRFEYLKEIAREYAFFISKM